MNIGLIEAQIPCQGIDLNKYLLIPYGKKRYTGL